MEQMSFSEYLRRILTAPPFQWMTPTTLADAPMWLVGLPGVYVISTPTLFGDRVLYVGESSDIGTRLKSHEWAPLWRAYHLAIGRPMTDIVVNIRSCWPSPTEAERRLEEQRLRAELKPILGFR